MIIGLQIKGDVVKGSHEEDSALLEHVELGSINNNTQIKLSSIKAACQSADLTHESKARAYVWYTLGSTIFQNKSRSSVPKTYLTFLGDMINKVPKYAWGAVTLAFLYNELGKASRSGAKGLSGCVTLLEVQNLIKLVKHFIYLIYSLTNKKVILIILFNL